MPRGGGVPTEALSALRRRLMALPMRHPERSVLMASTARLYAVSRATLYRLLCGQHRPHGVPDDHLVDMVLQKLDEVLAAGFCERVLWRFPQPVAPRQSFREEAFEQCDNLGNAV